MKRSKVRVGLSIVVIVIACGVAGLEFKESLAPDLSSGGQIRKLESYWPSRRRVAAKDLAQFSGEAEKVVPALVKALRDSDQEVRLNATESLKIFGEKSKAAGAAVTEILKQDPDGKIRASAAALLGVIKGRDAVPILIEALDDRDLAVRLEATRSLGRFGRGIASGPLVDKVMSGLGSEHPEDIRQASAETLDSLARDKEPVARAIADLAAKDPSPQVRYTAVGLMKTPIFAFQIPALVAALDDSSPRVRLLAGSNLAWIGMTDDRVVPALCHAALEADDMTREGIGMNFDLLVLDRATDKTPVEQLARRFQTAVHELRKVVETRQAGAREHAINVLGRLIANYEKTGKPTLLEPARTAALAVLARMEDEQEEVPLRLHAMNQWSSIQSVGEHPSSRTAGSDPAVPDRRDEFHARALWISALCRVLKSSIPEIRSRAVEIMMDNFKDPGTDPSFREAWRKAVSPLAEATKSEDNKVHNAALAILGMLGPEAGEALATLRSLVHDSPDAGVRQAARGATQSISSIDDLKAKDPAVRIAAAETLGRLGWRATLALPALIANLKDPEAKVRVAAAKALHALGPASRTAVAPLAAAFAGEADAPVRTAIVEAQEAIAPGTPLVLDVHLNALRDPDPTVRKAGGTFQQVPADDSVVSALETALGDANDDVRSTVAGSLTKVLFENPIVLPALLKAMRDNKQREAVVAALGNHLEKTSGSADFSRVRGDLSKLTATLGTAVPALSEALSLKNEEISPSVFSLLGRIVSFSRMSRDENLRKAIEPALQIYLQGLDQKDPSIREDVLGRLDAIPIGRADIVAALRKFLERSDLTAQERQAAQHALDAQAASDGSHAIKGSRRKNGAGGA